MAVDPIVHLVDDDEAVRRALAFLLGTAGFTVRVYESAVQLLDKFNGSPAGCIVSDVRMPAMDGIQLLAHLTARNITLPVIIMTGHADVALAVQAMKAGAVDFIEKPFADDTLIDAVQGALSRQQDAALADDDMGAVRVKLRALSEREAQVLRGLLVGHPNKTIAYDLGISPRTVEIHRASLMKKMASRSLSELVRMCLRAGFPDGNA